VARWSPQGDTEQPVDDKMVWTVTVLQAMPRLSQICLSLCLGEKTQAHRVPWVSEMPDGTKEPLDLHSEFVFTVGDAATRLP
jgi:hypothetical protein